MSAAGASPSTNVHPVLVLVDSAHMARQLKVELDWERLTQSSSQLDLLWVRFKINDWTIGVDE